MIKLINKVKPHVPAILAIIILVLLVFSSFVFFNWNKLKYGDMYSYRARMEVTKVSIQKYGDFIPLWSPYTMSGAPFFAKPGADIGFFYITYPLLFIFSLTTALKLAYILSIILAGIAMYSLMIYLKLDKKYALLSAIVYMFNGWLYTRLRYGHLGTIAPYAITPFIIIYLIKIFKEKEWVKNSVITGILFAIQIHAGPDLKITMWVVPIVVLYAIFALIGKFSTKQIKKIVCSGAIIAIVTFGLTAIKILPAMDYIEIGSRSVINFESARSQRVEWKNIFSDLIEPIPPEIYNYGAHYNVGIIIFLLAGFALIKKYKNKMTLYLTSIIILSIFLGTGSYMFYLFWKYVPYYSGFRYPSRILAIYILAMAALAGMGASALFNKLKEKFRWDDKKTAYAYITLIILILVNNVVFGVSPYRLDRGWVNPEEALKDNQILQYLGEQQGIFRIHTYETRGIDQGTEFQNIPLGLQSLYGYDTSWLVDYMNVYLSVALQQPAKFWGILNNKYLTSQTELNLMGFKFIKKFEKCEKCFPGIEGIQKIWGPYLYENEMFLPKAYVVNSSILVVGKKENAMQIVYGLMLDNNFNPSNTVIIYSKESIDQYPIGELKRFDAIFLTNGAITQNSLYILNEYKKGGGMLFPDVTAGEQSINNEKIKKMFDSFGGNLNAIEDKGHIFVNFDKRVLKTNKKSGFLVYSEILTFYPGWSALADGEEKDIYTADGVIGAVYLDRPAEEVTLEFKPKSFSIGPIITVIAIILVVLFFILRHYVLTKISKTPGRIDETQS